MTFPDKVLIVHDDPLAVPGFAARLKQLGSRVTDTVISMEDAVSHAQAESYALIAVSLSFVERLPGKGEQVRRQFNAPVIFLSPNHLVGEMLGLWPWEFCTPPFSEREIKMVAASAFALRTFQSRTQNLTRRLREEELLADVGRVAVRAGSDFTKLLHGMTESLAQLRSSARPEQYETLNALEALLARGDRLCRQLTLEGKRPGDNDKGRTGSARPFSGGTVLIVDDDESIRELSSCVARQLGMSVVVAESGEEALQRFQADPGRVGVVVIDLGLPHMSGVDVLAGLHAIRPGLPVIMITGHGEEAVDLDCRRSLSGLLRKPFSPDALRAALQRAKATEGVLC